jgi:hypothetical protein
MKHKVMQHGWRRHEYDPGYRFSVTHRLGLKTRLVPRFQPLCTGSVKVGSLGQKVVGRNKPHLNLRALPWC